MANLPDYVALAKSNPPEARAPWWTNTAQTYAGVMLWFVFWTYIPSTGASAANPAGLLSCGLGTAIAALVLAAFLCHILMYVVPGMLGMKTGLPLYIVGTSTYGVKGGFIMPGFLMGALQFGWLSVNAWGVGTLFTSIIQNISPVQAAGTPMCIGIAVAWALIAAFIGLKGIQYVAKVATFFPLIPLTILVVLFVKTMGGLGDFEPAKIAPPAAPAAAAAEETAPAAETAPAEETAPAAETAPATETAPAAETAPAVETAPAAETAPAEETAPAAESTSAEAADAAAPAVEADAQAASEAALEETAPAAETGKAYSTFDIFNLMAIYILGFFATAGAAGCDMGSSNRDAKDIQMGGLFGVFGSTVFAGALSLAIVAGAYGSGLVAYDQPIAETTSFTNQIMGDSVGKIMMFLLAVASFPSACFCSMIAANSFKTTFAKVNPFITCGLGVFGAILLIVTSYAGSVASVFAVIGASFGPICGAMMADYFLAGRKWNGPRAGFNPAGWLSWAAGFAVGAMGGTWGLPCPPLLACLTGLVLYTIFAKIGLESATLEMEQQN